MARQFTVDAELAVLVARYFRELDARFRHDADILAALVRALQNPRGTCRVHVEAFRELLRDLVFSEGDSNAGDHQLQRR